MSKISSIVGSNQLYKMPDFWNDVDLRGLSDKHLAFCEAYSQCLNNMQACREVGYSDRQGRNLLNRADVNAYLNFIAHSRRNDAIIKPDELLVRLSAVARGDVKEEVVLMDGRTVLKGAFLRDQLKALEMLQKGYGMDKPTDETTDDVTISIGFADDEIIDADYSEVVEDV